MSRFKKVKYNGHILKTRRDFLSHGFITGVGAAALPSLYALLRTEQLYGACASEGGANLAGAAAYAIDASGGINLAGNDVVVRTTAGELLTSYSALGLPDELHPSNAAFIDSTFGLEMHVNSPLLQGLKAGMGNDPLLMAKVNSAIVCTVSDDDSGNNLLGVAPGMAMVSQGRYTSLTGARNKASGGRHNSPFQLGAAPVIVSSANDLTGLVTPGPLTTRFGAAGRDKLLKAIQNLSETQLKKFLMLAPDKQLEELIRCGHVDSQALFSADASSVQPSANVATAFTDATSQDAALAWSVVSGTAGAAAFEIGGGDYHNRGVTSTHAKNVEVGEAVGRALRLALLENRKIMVTITTDGGVAAGNNAESDGTVNKLAFRADSGQRSAAMAFCADPAGRPKFARNQIGAFKSDGGGSVDNAANKVSTSPEACASVLVANFQKFHEGKIDIAKFYPDSPISNAEFNANDSEYVFVDEGVEEAAPAAG
ncbi:MAG: hypothetical protein AB8C84_05050 [Oligoflexales bacterium]